jgi:hypothetical protein
MFEVHGDLLYLFGLNGTNQCGDSFLLLIIVCKSSRYKEHYYIHKTPCSSLRIYHQMDAYDVFIFI